MTTESLKDTFRRELPEWLRQDPDLRAYILDLMRREYANREETQDRFYELLTELRRDREEQRLHWEEQNGSLSPYPEWRQILFPLPLWKTAGPGV